MIAEEEEDGYEEVEEEDLEIWLECEEEKDIITCLDKF